MFIVVSFTCLFLLYSNLSQYQLNAQPDIHCCMFDASNKTSLKCFHLTSIDIFPRLPNKNDASFDNANEKEKNS